jgi:putative peptidoglycan lipid II flippase
MIFRLLNFLKSDSVNRKILRAALIIGVFTCLARGGTVLRELVVARTFGRGDALDSFLIALLLPAFFVTIISGTLGSAFIPVFLEVQHKHGREAAEKLLANVALASVLVLCGAALLLGLFASQYLPYIAHGFSDEKLQLTRRLLYLLLPWVIFGGTSQLLTYVLNAGEKFALPALVPLTTPFVVIGFVLLTARTWGGLALSAGTLVGGVLEAGFLLMMLRAHGMRFSLWWNGLDHNVSAVLHQAGPLLAGSILMASTPVIIQALAAMLPPGSVSAIGYANRLISALTGLGATALSTATLPYFAKMTAAQDWPGCRHTLKRYSGLLLLTTIPFTVIFILISRPLVRVLYQHGAFTAADTQVVSLLQSLLALQIPFVLMCALLVRFLSAIKRNDLLLYVSVLNVAANIALNLVLMRTWGLPGIALSTSLMYVISFAFLATCTVKLIGERYSAHALAQGQEAHH